MPKKKQEMQYRYYEMPEDSFVFALTGKSWVRVYGEGIDSLHFHNYMEVGLCYEGTGEMIYDDQVFPFEPGCFTLIPPNYPHTTNSVPGTYGFWEYLFIDCEGLLNQVCHKKPEMVHRLLEQLYRRAYFFKPGEQQELLTCIKKIFTEQAERKPLYKAESDALLTIILSEIIRTEEEREEKEGSSEAVRIRQLELRGRRKSVLTPPERPESVSVTDAQSPEIERLRPALKYIKEHYMDEIYISKLADSCALSETHFRRIFHDCMHLSPLEYINSVRIHTACVLLRTTDKTICSVAFDTGFSSVSTFQRNFQKYIGMATHEWRNHPDNYEYKLQQYKINTYEGW